MYGYKWLFLLICVMAGVSVLVSGIAIGILYQAALGEQRARLIDTAQSQARLMESIARFDKRYLDGFPGGPKAATLQQIEDAHRQYAGFGKTGGFAFARRDGDKIVFLHSHRAGLERPKPVPFDSQLAQPMQRALNGESGTIVGADYLGREVLAAFEPVDELDMGIVAKIDTAEVRAPFARAALVAAGAGSIVVMLGALFFVGLTNPIIRRLQRRERALRREHEFSESLINTAQHIVLVLDNEGRILRFNPYFEELSGWRLDEAEGRDWFDTFLPEHNRQQIRRLFGRAIEGEQTRGNTNAILTKDGRELDIEWYDAPLTSGKGEQIGLLCTGLNVSERRVMEREILEIAAEEQRRIGQELHDSTQQQLTGLSLLAQNLAAAFTKLAGEPAVSNLADRMEELRERATKVQTGLEQATAEVNQLARGLMPVEVDTQGLMSSLRELAGRVSATERVECTFVTNGPIEVLNNTAATHLYRIAQEAVNNALKHSGADRIELSLEDLHGFITLRILDNGCGIGNNRTAGPGMGLRIMAYRAELIGALLTVDQGDNGGTEVICRIRH